MQSENILHTKQELVLAMSSFVFDDKCVHVGVSEYDRYFSKRETIGNFMNGVVDFYN